MKTLLRITVTVCVLVAPLCYIASQQPRVWCNRQWAGIALLKGWYRSWTLSFCDGFATVGGKLQPVVIEGGGVRPGYYRWPRFGRADVRGLRLADQ